MKLIKTETEYESALERLNKIFDADPISKNGEEGELLALLIEEYEREHYPISSPDPIDAITIRMEELNLKQKDLVEEIGTKSIVSEVLNKRRKLTVKMIRKLSNRLKIAADVLVQEYQLKT
jgi:HTH-type transcriptional regulator/antitoxin HigA